MHRTLAVIRRTIRAALHTDPPLRYRVLSGSVAADVAAGRLIQCSTFLTRLGLDEQQVRSYRSWFGRYAAKAWRATNGTEPQRVWALIDSHWTHVAVYPPTSPVFAIAIESYKRMAALGLRFELAV
ncbi:hypothetical protein FHS39_002547 [Streptomyces olivoverticillatus]|uniref:Uncharacterized protein n=1 Tax=Streptomyces olivoverticillatus TaxID=66427 RepID=A0A7W7LPU8_9ACTN|nr:hypothetical protein [Streptomyces olivoverticillatus]MBB4893516.1 hypothetical protein [Streptomyces olivoverticillatus]